MTTPTPRTRCPGCPTAVGIVPGATPREPWHKCPRCDGSGFLAREEPTLDLTCKCGVTFTATVDPPGPCPNCGTIAKWRHTTKPTPNPRTRCPGCGKCKHLGGITAQGGGMRKFRQCDGSGWLALGVDGRIVPKPTPTDTERLAAVHELIEAARDLTDYGMGCSLVSQLTSPRTNYCSAHGAEVSGGGWPCRYEQRCQRLRAAIDAATTNDD